MSDQNKVEILHNQAGWGKNPNPDEPYAIRQGGRIICQPGKHPNPGHIKIVTFRLREDAERWAANWCGSVPNAQAREFTREAFIAGLAAMRVWFAEKAASDGDTDSAVAILRNWNPDWGKDPGPTPMVTSWTMAVLQSLRLSQGEVDLG